MRDDIPADLREDYARANAPGAFAPKHSANRNGAHPPQRKEDEKPVPILVRVSSVQPEPVKWLWRPWLPDGCLSVLDGDPGLGKSTLTLDLAARVTRGWVMPPGSGGGPVPPGTVLLLSAEDSLPHTIRPRLDAAGADSDRVDYLKAVHFGGRSRPPILPGDLKLVADVIKDRAVRLMIVDPLMAFLGDDHDAHKDQDIRRCLHPLSVLAEQLGVAILLLRHLNKLNGGAALYRGGGSIGITGAARAALVVGRDPDDPDTRVLAMNKSNLGPMPSSLAYRLEPDGDTTKVGWIGETELTRDDILWHATAHGPAAKGRPDDALQTAARWLADVLSGEPVPADELRERSRAAGLSWRTVQSAKTDLEVRSFKIGSRWFWAASANGDGKSGCDRNPFDDLPP
jgi:hypothetical protein